MTDRLLEDVNELIRLGHGDQDRLAHIKKSLENDKSLFKSDLDYVTNLITQHLSQHPPPREQPNTEKQDATPGKSRTSNASRAGIAVGAVFLLILAFVFILPELDSISFDRYDDRYVEPYVDPYVVEYEEPDVVEYEPNIEYYDPTELPPFVDPYTDPQYYVDRYNNEPDYKKWFDAIYPEYSSIYEAVGLDEPPVFEEPLDPVVIPEKEPEPSDPEIIPEKEPEPSDPEIIPEKEPELPDVEYYDNPAELPPFVDPYTDPQYYVDRYNNEPAYREWFDAIYPEYSSIYEAVELDEPPVFEKPLGPGAIPKKEPEPPKQEELPVFEDLSNSLPSIRYYDPQGSEFDRLEKEKFEILSRTNPVIAGLIYGSITYYVEPLPSYSTYNITLFDEYLDGRSAEGVKLERVYDENEADFFISWVKDYGPHIGGVAYSGTSATIGLGSTNCVGDWQHFDDWSITKIAWHEIGHILGYNHSEDPNNIMWPTTYTKYNIDQDIKEVIAGGWWWTFVFCQEGDHYYNFETDIEKNEGFELIVLPQETNTTQFISDGIGSYYPDCAEFGKKWLGISSPCNVESGSKIVIRNTNDNAIRIEGQIINRNQHPEIDTEWDENAYDYDPEDLDYIRNLFSDQP